MFLSFSAPVGLRVRSLVPKVTQAIAMAEKAGRNGVKATHVEAVHAQQIEVVHKEQAVTVGGV